jgi:hypothetical protein
MLAVLGEAGVGLGVFASTITPAWKPTVTETEPLTGVYELLLASVKDTVAVFVMTVPSGVWAIAGAAASVSATTARAS